MLARTSNPMRSWHVDYRSGKHQWHKSPTVKRRLGIKRFNKIFKMDCMRRFEGCILKFVSIHKTGRLRPDVCVLAHTQGSRPEGRVLSQIWRPVPFIENAGSRFRIASSQGARVASLLSQSRVPTKQLRVTFPLMSQSYVLINSSEPRSYHKWEPPLSQELSAVWVYHSWPCHNKVAKDCISTHI